MTDTYIITLVYPSKSRVQEKLKAMLRSWAEGDFKGDPQLALIPSLYNQLKKEGITFSSSSVSSQVSRLIKNLLEKSNAIIIIHEQYQMDIFLGIPFVTSYNFRLEKSIPHQLQRTPMLFQINKKKMTLLKLFSYHYKNPNLHRRSR